MSEYYILVRSSRKCLCMLTVSVARSPSDDNANAILTYNYRTVTHLHNKWGVAVGSTVIGAGTRHLPPSRIPPALGQTGVRGANVNCRAWLTDDRNSSVAGVSAAVLESSSEQNYSSMAETTRHPAPCSVAAPAGLPRCWS